MATPKARLLGRIESLSSGQEIDPPVDGRIERKVIALGLICTSGSLVVAGILGLALKRPAT